MSRKSLRCMIALSLIFLALQLFSSSQADTEKHLVTTGLSYTSILKSETGIISVPESGTGTVRYPDIGTYTGSFEKSRKSGEGSFLWDNGDFYQGEWLKDKMHGEGTLQRADGVIQEGQFRNGKLYSGTIVATQPDGSVLTRTVSKGNLDADAKLLWPDLTRIEGKMNSRGTDFSGKVKVYYLNGDTYEGTLKNSLKSGTGTYQWKNGAHYTGNWKDDKMNGKGAYYFGESTKINYLRGSFENNVPSGTVTYVAGSGLKYKTRWKNGKCVSIEYSKED